MAHARLIGEEMSISLLCLIRHHVRAPLSSWTKMQGQLEPTAKVPDEHTVYSKGYRRQALRGAVEGRRHNGPLLFQGPSFRVPVSSHPPKLSSL